MIQSFADKRTAALFLGKAPKGFPADLRRRAKIKLDILDAATDLAFLRVPPGNRLEALSGDRAGQFSIRINDRWRICFAWYDGSAWDVEVVDYH